MTVSSNPTKNKPGRVGVKRRRPTTNQALKAEVSHLQMQLNSAVPSTELDDAYAALSHVEELTAKSRTGVAHKVYEFVSAFMVGVR